MRTEPLALSSTKISVQPFLKMPIKERKNGYMKQVKHCPYEHDTHRRAIASLFKQVEQMNDEARFSLWNALQKAGKLVDDSLIVKDHP